MKPPKKSKIFVKNNIIAIKKKQKPCLQFFLNTIYEITNEKKWWKICINYNLWFPNYFLFLNLFQNLSKTIYLVFI